MVDGIDLQDRTLRSRLIHAEAALMESLLSGSVMQLIKAGVTFCSSKISSFMKISRILEIELIFTSKFFAERSTENVCGQPVRRPFSAITMSIKAWDLTQLDKR